MASLAIHKDMFAKVVPLDQSFEKGDYIGAFRFRFWRYGKWEEVVVDDYLPTINGRLFLNRSHDLNKFWSALLEKAYAKIHGSYGALRHGRTEESFTDFSGGIVETFCFSKYPFLSFCLSFFLSRYRIPDNLFEIMFKADQKGALMSCSVLNDKGIGHAYSITKVIKEKGKQHQLVRVRNPHGKTGRNGRNGLVSWSDTQIKKLPAETNPILDYLQDNGEFDMSMNDFLKRFKGVSICHLKEDRRGRSNDDGSTHGLYEVKAVHGSWKAGVNAGGCHLYLETFATNPQYKFTIKDTDLDDDKMAMVLIGLMQKGARTKIGKDMDAYQATGLYIYSIKESTKLPLDTDFFRAKRISLPRLFYYSVEFKRLTLEPGTYVVIPCTFEPNKEAEFYLRIFTENGGRSSNTPLKPTKPTKPSTPLPPLLSKLIKHAIDYRMVFLSILSMAPLIKHAIKR